MELFRIIKSDARNALRFCGGRTVSAMLIVFLAYLAINLTESVLLLAFCGTDALYIDYTVPESFSAEAVAITGGSAAVYFIVMSVIVMGYTKLHFAFAEGSDESIITLFDMFSSAKKFFGSLFFHIEYCLRLIITAALAIFPGTALFYFAYSYIPEGNHTVELLKISACCIAISIVILCLSLWLIFIQRWHLAKYYFISGKGFFKSFSISSKASKGLRTSLLKFKLSFIGWGFLSFLILPMIWSVPYYMLSEAIYSKYLMERYEHSLARIPGDDFFEPEEEPNEA